MKTPEESPMALFKDLADVVSDPCCEDCSNAAEDHMTAVQYEIDQLLLCETPEEVWAQHKKLMRRFEWIRAFVLEPR